MQSEYYDSRERLWIVGFVPHLPMNHCGDTEVRSFLSSGRIWHLIVLLWIRFFITCSGFPRDMFGLCIATARQWTMFLIVRSCTVQLPLRSNLIPRSLCCTHQSRACGGAGVSNKHPHISHPQFKTQTLRLIKHKSIFSQNATLTCPNDWQTARKFNLDVSNS